MATTAVYSLIIEPCGKIKKKFSQSINSNKLKLHNNNWMVSYIIVFIRNTVWLPPFGKFNDRRICKKNLLECSLDCPLQNCVLCVNNKSKMAATVEQLQYRKLWEK